MINATLPYRRPPERKRMTLWIRLVDGNIRQPGAFCRGGEANPHSGEAAGHHALASRLQMDFGQGYNGA